MKFTGHIHASQKMTAFQFQFSVIFPLALPSGQNNNFAYIISINFAYIISNNVTGKLPLMLLNHIITFMLPSR